MDFFVAEGKRKESNSTCYFEFQRGYYHGKCWLEDSINIRDTLWDEYHMSDLIGSVIKDFDYYGITIVTRNQWDEITKTSKESECIWHEVIKDAAPWVFACFKEYDVFTILGM